MILIISYSDIPLTQVTRLASAARRTRRASLRTASTSTSCARGRASACAASASAQRRRMDSTPAGTARSAR